MSIKNGVPEGHPTLTAHLVVKDAAKAIAWYGKVFGAEELYRLPAPDGSIAHADLKIGSSLLWIADENPQMGALAPTPAGSNPASLALYTADADKTFARAIEAGATALMPVTDMFWGARYGQFKDPFGHKWSVMTQVREVGVDEMKRAMAAMAKPA